MVFCSWAGPSSGFGGRFFFGGAVLRMRIQTGDPRKALLYVLIGLRIRATSGSEEKKNMYVERENPQGEGGWKECNHQRGVKKPANCEKKGGRWVKNGRSL